jgi:uncharacterized ferredoxin-like protein
MAREQRDTVGRLGVVDEVVIRLVEHDQRRVIAERLEEAEERALADDRARRIVR